MNAMTARRLLFSLSALSATALVAPSVRAQDTLPPLVFLHGFADNSWRWYDAQAVLNSRGFQTQAFDRNTTGSSISTQGSVTRTQIESLPSIFHNPILVGHSMGGLAAREASTLTPITAILTVGSPHHGHPALNASTSLAYWYALGTLSADLNLVLNNLNHCGQYRGGYPGEVEGPCYTVWEFAFGVAWFREVVEIAQQYFFPGPAVDDIRPGSGFLNSFNGSSHVSAESGAERVAVIATLAPSEYSASVWRAIGNDHSDALYYASIAAVVGVATVYQGLDIISEGGWSDPWHNERLVGGLAVVNTGVFIAGMSEWWNDIVGGWPNDGFVPGWTQDFPNANPRNLVGYAHMEEPSAIELIDFVDQLGSRHKR